jgi:hypothetical protein
VTPFAAVQKPSVAATIGGLVLLLGLVALVVFGARVALRKLRSGRTPASPDEQALAAATNSLDQACRTFKKNVADASAAVSSAQRKYATAVSAAEKRAANARALPCLGRAGRIKVYADRIVTPEGVRPMDEHVKAVVDAAGVIAVTRRHTLTRFALLGPLSLFTPKATTHDNRELYFLVEHPQWASLVKLNPNAGMAARKVCATLNLAARQASANRAARAQRIGEFDRQLGAARANRAEIEKAEGLLVARAIGGFAEIDELRSTVDARISLCAADSPAVKRATKVVRKAETLRPST